MFTEQRISHYLISHTIFHFSLNSVSFSASEVGMCFLFDNDRITEQIRNLIKIDFSFFVSITILLLHSWNIW